MTDDERLTELKKALIDQLGEGEVDRANKAIVAACMLSEGMDMTFEVFSDPGEAISAIVACISRVAERHGVRFASTDLRNEKLH